MGVCVCAWYVLCVLWVGGWVCVCVGGCVCVCGCVWVCVCVCGWVGVCVCVEIVLAIGLLTTKKKILSASTFHPDVEYGLMIG